MKKRFASLCLVSALLLTLQGCGTEPEEKIGEYAVTWGLKLQIGDYVLDSIFSYADTTGRRFDSTGSYDYVVVMNRIKEKVPNYYEAPHIGKIYGWDPECFEFIGFFPKGGRGGWTHRLSVDSLGNFDFSKVFYAYPGGIDYAVLPLPFYGDERIKKCYRNNPDIIVRFNIL